jgi:hypothetical protein
MASAAESVEDLQRLAKQHKAHVSLKFDGPYTDASWIAVFSPLRGDDVSVSNPDLADLLEDLVHAVKEIP